MNIFILDLASKWISLMLISAMSFFGLYKETNLNINNTNDKLGVEVLSFVEDYETVVKYNKKIPKNITKLITKGQDKITYKKEDGTEQILQESIPEVLEKGSGEYGIYTGRLTGYSAECAGCSATGTVACKTEDKSKFSLKSDGIYYNDSEYGKVRILSSATAFPCGTIIEVSKNENSYYAVVLDRGATMNNSWKNGTVWMDLAFENNEAAKKTDLTGKNITFSVQRWGW